MKIAALELINAGLVVVPYTSPFRPWRRRGKAPLWHSFPDSPRSDEDRARVEISGAGALDEALRREPWMNLAVLGLAQVDADNQDAIDLARDLGVSGNDRSWMIQTGRGWRALYRPPAIALTPVTKNGASKDQLKAAKESGGELIELDLLVKVPAIVPPSIHPTGKPYLWAPGHSPRDIKFRDLAEPPSLLIDHWQNITRPRHRASPASQIRQGGDFDRAMMDWARSLPSKDGIQIKSNGWTTEVECPLPGHTGTDPRFAINLEMGIWKCWSLHQTGSLRKLADSLNLNVPTRSMRRGGHTRSEAYV